MGSYRNISLVLISLFITALFISPVFAYTTPTPLFTDNIAFELFRIRDGAEKNTNNIGVLIFTLSMSMFFTFTIYSIIKKLIWIR